MSRSFTSTEIVKLLLVCSDVEYLVISLNFYTESIVIAMIATFCRLITKKLGSDVFDAVNELQANVNN